MLLDSVATLRHFFFFSLRHAGYVFRHAFAIALLPPGRRR